MPKACLKSRFVFVKHPYGYFFSQQTGKLSRPDIDADRTRPEGLYITAFEQIKYALPVGVYIEEELPDFVVGTGFKMRS